MWILVDENGYITVQTSKDMSGDERFIFIENVPSFQEGTRLKYDASTGIISSEIISVLVVNEQPTLEDKINYIFYKMQGVIS